jgi:site-specific DNA recombinase
VPVRLRPSTQPTPQQRGLGNDRCPRDPPQPALHRPSGLNKQRTDEVLIDVEDIALGHENKHRWNDQSEWIWSKTQVPEPLITTDLYDRAQATIKVRGSNGEEGRAPRRSTRPYLFRGLITCGLCDRHMVGNPNHGRLYYRCKASRDFVRQHEVAHPPMLYVREDAIIEPVDRFLSKELNVSTLTANLRALADAHYRTELAEYRAGDQTGPLRQSIADCDAKIERYRATLDAGGDPALIAGWIREASKLKANAEAALRLNAAPPQRLNDDQFAALVDGLGGLLGVLREADPRDKASFAAASACG